jgi:hypothetical protein
LDKGLSSDQSGPNTYFSLAFLTSEFCPASCRDELSKRELYAQREAVRQAAGRLGARRLLAEGRRRADTKAMAGSPLGRVAPAILLYPFLYVGVLAVVGRSLPSVQEGPIEVVLLAIVLIILGFALSSWWCRVAPLLWAVVALAVGLGVPLENTDPREGQLLIFLVLMAGLVHSAWVLPRAG